MSNSKEAKARIKINKLLEEAGWRFFDTEKGTANIQLEPNDCFATIAKDYPKLEKEYQRLEPTKNRMNKAKTEALTSVRAQWLPTSVQNRLTRGL